MPNTKANQDTDAEKSVVDDRDIPDEGTKDEQDTAGGREGQFSDKERRSKEAWSPGSHQPPER